MPVWLKLTIVIVLNMIISVTGTELMHLTPPAAMLFGVFVGVIIGLPGALWAFADDF